MKYGIFESLIAVYIYQTMLTQHWQICNFFKTWKFIFGVKASNIFLNYTKCQKYWNLKETCRSYGITVIFMDNPLQNILKIK